MIPGTSNSISPFQQPRWCGCPSVADRGAGVPACAAESLHRNSLATSTVTNKNLQTSRSTPREARKHRRKKARVSRNQQALCGSNQHRVHSQHKASTMLSKLLPPSDDHPPSHKTLTFTPIGLHASLTSPPPPLLVPLLVVCPLLPAAPPGGFQGHAWAGECFPAPPVSAAEGFARPVLTLLLLVRPPLPLLLLLLLLLTAPYTSRVRRSSAVSMESRSWCHLGCRVLPRGCVQGRERPAVMVKARVRPTRVEPNT